jgi:hypothetical protein
MPAEQRRELDYYLDGKSNYRQQISIAADNLIG